mmetsp:Transcript_35245/g.97544  ORF Transcript_35245/g.97544 Transcript_35245/m.97544 type:complete len:232 (-) Transcript_35245:369-1064(-)
MICADRVPRAREAEVGPLGCAELRNVCHRRHPRRRRCILRKRHIGHGGHALQELCGEDEWLVWLEKPDANPKGTGAVQSIWRRGLKELLRFLQNLPVREGVPWVTRRLDRAGGASVVHHIQILGLLRAVPLAVVWILCDALWLRPAHRIQRHRVGKVVIQLAGRGDIVAVALEVLRKTDPALRGRPFSKVRVCPEHTCDIGSATAEEARPTRRAQGRLRVRREERHTAGGK